jgi:diguanylate cyclase (GGDEF)-like protein
MNSEFGILGLREGVSEPLIRELRAALDRLFQMVCAASPFPEGGADGTAFRHRINLCRAVLADESDADRMKDICESLLGLCQKTLDKVRRDRAVAGDELESVISIVRDAMATITGQEQSYRDRQADSASRLGALQQVPDIGELKARLAYEVTELKHLAEERAAQWRETAGSLESRVATLEQQLQESRAEAMHDPLTGISNRRGLETSFSLMQPERRPLTLAIVDIDGFKALNDARGHAAGDETLRVIAKTLQASVRTHEVVSRLGGDEFVLVMLDVTLAQSEHRLRSIIAALTSAATPVAGSRLTASSGVAEFSAGDTFDSLLHRADQALYDAKRLGKNRVVSRQAPFIRNLR